MAIKRITQPTFDAAVKENMVDFDLELQDAINDTITQFQNQGVTLDNIDVSGGAEMPELIVAIETIKNFSMKVTDSASDLASSLTELKKLSNPKGQYYTRNLRIIIENGCLAALYKIIEIPNTMLVKKQVLETIICLTKTDDYRDFFEPGGSIIIKSIFEENFVSAVVATSIDTSATISLLHMIIKLARCVGKPEKNKLALMKNDAPLYISTVLTNTQVLKEVDAWQSVIQECCLLIRELCLHNDIRVDMSCAYENSKIFVKNSALMECLSLLSLKYQQYPILASTALSAIRTLAINEEAVEAIAQLNMIDVCKSILLHYQDDRNHKGDDATIVGPLKTVTYVPFSAPITSTTKTPPSLHQGSSSPSQSEYLLIRSCLGLIRNLCNDDSRKACIANNGILEMVLYYVCKKEFKSDSTLIENGISCLANISLRSVPNSIKIMENDGANIIASLIRGNSAQVGVLKQCCCLVRNIAGRCPQYHSQLLDAGLEELIRGIGTTYRVIVDESYAALRDLHCDVKIVAIDSAGKVTSAFESFGCTDSHVGHDHDANSCSTNENKNNLNFNPIFETSAPDLNDNIQNESQAPFSSEGFSM